MEIMDIGIIGAGGWGTALAHHLSGKGIAVSLWAFEKDLPEIIKRKGENTLYLPGINIPPGIKTTNHLKDVVSGKPMVLLVTPSHVARDVLKKALPYLREECILISASKGIENTTLLTMSQMIEEVMGLHVRQRLAVVSGPSFAREVANKLPTVVTVASANRDVALEIQKTFATSYLRVYTSEDVIGVEMGGALKNIIAIGAGISDGLGLGNNSRAALITRGLAEISRLAVKMGANPLTLAGLSGMGDLILTCTGDLSRNRSLGIELAKGRKLNDLLSEMKMVAEGVKTTYSAYQLSRKMEVEMPITEQIFKVLYEGESPRKAVRELMERELKDELG